MIFHRVQCFHRTALFDILQPFEKSWISDASRKKWAWALRAFEEWRRERNLAISKDGDSVEQKLHSSLEEMSDDHLDHSLARFVAEVRKVDGKEYPGKTIYEMINSIQTYLRVECKRNLTLIDKSSCVFRKLNSALNYVLKDRAQQGLGVEICQAKGITE